MNISLTWLLCEATVRFLQASLVIAGVAAIAANLFGLGVIPVELWYVDAWPQGSRIVLKFAFFYGWLAVLTPFLRRRLRRKGFNMMLNLVLVTALAETLWVFVFDGIDSAHRPAFWEYRDLFLISGWWSTAGGICSIIAGLVPPTRVHAGLQISRTSALYEY